MSHVPPRRFGSLAAAMVTPMTESGEVDVTSAQRLAGKLVDEGCDAILLSGTTGESPTTHQPEKNDLTDAVREAVGNRAFILCGACSNDTAHAVRIAEGAQEHGADGILVVSPYYNRPSQEGLRAHVHAVANATDLPIMLYDIPGRTGIAFSDATLDVLAQHPRIRAVKDSTGDIETGVERMHRTGLEYYSGDDGLNFAWMTGGASGFISVVAHIASTHYRRMIELLDGDRVWEARELSYSLRPLVHAIMGGGQGAVLAKYALWLQGVIDSPAVRLPMVGISDAEVSALRRAMSRAGLV
ncbi:4-hydroxy-tetrahydrodipicolinate synthase [Schaalia meyeri]|uniref:4-hydroxy-tetrahydrodipicolinate synthase n=1 Tax=Schaalia meyeri TaxID=52773 RepID=A0AAP9YAS6_9ACTO|nr:4-hydroxy-tetrahydrodipicolinate synthase [Schaalia meyeri]OFQ25395.1 4-hydroxy-tetrahydrodipicolinate synthase [Actinomyces sp. HMSC062G12]QQC43096.1 4-hydroxy-tetrahydrodipicolinate synthase [Schaalia meyeri]SDR64487.1 4-hydroxy-tetrahydrodipicolinate synthase [Schaalia meyeri]